MVETRSGKMQDPAQERAKFEESAKPQPVIDHFKVYYQIPIAEENQKKTAVIVPFLLVEFNAYIMCFGVSIFQSFINEVLFDLDFVFPYISAILIASVNKDTQENHFDMIFEKLLYNGLRINANKSKFGVQEVKFLG
ncbi:hypothetical protein LAZ67_X003574 [Cordylochernes scorpioides]|uniref:Reverse transcriptase domain-containing protein n=1 Tax=Cordylochernes scorpioides TaxID=51811 RepID=A0ABY6LU76_9ARAC|nr:hypothetical protein LAZ67_X003574 [Cordylochernes scorpioides]